MAEGAIFVEKKICDIMIAFVSTVTRPDQTDYRSADDDRILFSGVQTNEAAVYQMQYTLRGRGGLDRIILVKSDGVTKDVSFKDAPQKKKWEALLAEHGCSAMSSIEFLKAQITKRHPELAERFEESSFRETSGMGEAMKYIADLGDVIQNVRRAAEEAGIQDVVLHADMTGGLRYASMMMLAVMQLSKYMGIHIGHVVYSEIKQGEQIGHVRFADDVHRMFDLTAGADEFQKYGSVQALEEYFGDTEGYSAPFRSLLGAMRRFSDAIRICRTGIIEKELEQLGEHIRVFRNQSGGLIQEELFRRIISVIEREYASVLHNDADAVEERRLNIIAWCLRKKFLQQAMTLCSEWIPQIIVAKRICYTEDAYVRDVCAKKAETGMRSWQQEFIISYNSCTTTMIRTAIIKKKETNRIEEFPEKVQRQLYLLVDGYEKDFERRKDKNILVEPIHTESIPLLRAIQHFKELKGRNTKVLSYRELWNRIAQCRDAALCKILNISIQDIETPMEESGAPLTPEARSARKWRKREHEYRTMLRSTDTGIMRADVPLETVLYFLHGYFQIREERNQSNHAVVTAGKGNDELEQYIAAYIEKLRSIQVGAPPCAWGNTSHHSAG